ncbi:lysophospholipase [Paenibacillus rhizovicinus]|uniref:Lysophospholipase n=1 Tax=Paenibacillus rhizovicinus TaxID=2704463 RepID=A0A6C0PBF3_9BACL|nr:GDSL-type esterase/lipase family protein [Paenibacillus rhizovicinus]QHW33912.1 lysophospholipase [Paenibacillus rhizovicinus]
MKTKKSSLLALGVLALTISITACSSSGNNGQTPGEESAANRTSNTAASADSKAQSAYEKQYRTSVFLGDSITEGLSYHDVLREGNVLAGAGKTAEFAQKDVGDLVGRQPEHVYIQLGSDDILWPADNPQQYSLTHYAQLIHAIQSELPKARITLLSVTPVTAEAKKAEPRYQNIGKYNEGLKELASQEHVEYVDLTSLVNGHSDLYDTDGIHFQAAFYPILLDYLKDR